MLFLADRQLPDNVKGIIADCGFTSPKEIIKSVYRRVLRLPPLLSVWMAGVFARLFAGVDLNSCDTRVSLAGSRLPVLLIHGEEDTFVPCQMTREAFAACAGRKNVLIVKNAEHGMSYLTDGIAYAAHVIDFLKENLPGFSIPEQSEE